mgnify:CR=1 FL=1
MNVSDKIILWEIFQTNVIVRTTQIVDQSSVTLNNANIIVSSSKKQVIFLMTAIVSIILTETQDSVVQTISVSQLVQ